MSFELLEVPIVWIPVKWPGLVAGENDGVALSVEHEIELLVEIVEAEEARAIFGLPAANGGEAGPGWTIDKACERLVSNWRRVVVNKNPIPFNSENLAKLIARPGFAFGFTKSYLEALQGRTATRSGN